MSRLTRRQYLMRGGMCSLAALAGCLAGPEDSPETPRPDTTVAGDDGDTLPSVTLGVEPIASGFTSPVDVVTFGTDRYLVADQPGRIDLVDGGGTETVLDLSERVVPVSGYSEQGLLGLAVHPSNNERVFVRYSAPPREGTPSGYSHTFVLAEFAIEHGSAAIDPETERTILEIPEPQSNHNAGDLAFGPDGYLYVPVGDGGAAADQGAGHVEDWYSAVGGGNGQDVTENLLGGILRIDVDTETETQPYGVPDNNPLVGQEGLNEHFAWGMRNPWRISFGPTGRCFAADVGQNRYEEVNVITRGGNYGWNVREGTDCFGASDCPTASPDGEPLQPPVIQYPHGNAPVSGVAIIGGRVYAGSAMPSLQDHYVFGDWRADDRLFIAQERQSGLWATGTLSLEGNAGSMLLSIGEDVSGELLIATTREGGVSGETGAINRLVRAE